MRKLDSLRATRTSLESNAVEVRLAMTAEERSCATFDMRASEQRAAMAEPVRKLEAALAKVRICSIHRCSVLPRHMA